VVPTGNRLCYMAAMGAIAVSLRQVLGRCCVCLFSKNRHERRNRHERSRAGLNHAGSARPRSVGGAIEAVLEPFERKGRIRYYIRNEGPCQVSFLDDCSCGHGCATGDVVERIVG
jgi:hypothetical protein